ncbi:hypothetical protein, partial [Allocoleopsis sp.]|uniref:hypothetical protein n=1 Tax=Allocoleopsis sp. TaxID=3088169 RepID=UPI002FD772A5
NAISEIGVASLARALTDNQSVTGLWLKRNPIGTAGAYHIAQMLRHNRTIRTLDLVSTQMGEDGLAAILDALIHTNRTVERLYLGGNQINPDQTYWLADLLRHNPSINGLFLNVNCLGDAGVEVLAEGLQENQTLSELGLASNGITAKGCRALVASLQNHSSLSHLDLGYSPSTKILGGQPNSIGDTGAAIIAHFLMHNPTLVELNLQSTGISTRGKIILTKALERNHKLCHLLLNGRLNANVESLLERNRSLNPSYQLARPRAIALIRSVYR